ncbi:hypothetical protein Ciccas_006012 [Cichlidogyrus casuarinus]|uniref:Fibronectin type-III domain-containing protein n=1 Tax=Cichlidogyrus casuarinus TaxID=1844966 RepID=A0ABD2Q714_9PLAT
MQAYSIYSERLDSASDPNAMPSPPKTFNLEMQDYEKRDKEHNFFVSHLDPDQVYLISVSAINSIGEGPRSQPTTVLTTPRVLPAPRNLRAYAESYDQVVLEWEPPWSNVDDSSYPLLEYLLRVEYTANNLHMDKIPDRRISKNPSSTIVRDLVPNSEYLFRLASVTQGGPGLFAEVVAKTKPFGQSSRFQKLCEKNEIQNNDHRIRSGNENTNKMKWKADSMEEDPE